MLANLKLVYKYVAVTIRIFSQKKNKLRLCNGTFLLLRVCCCVTILASNDLTPLYIKVLLLQTLRRKT